MTPAPSPLPADRLDLPPERLPLLAALAVAIGFGAWAAATGGLEAMNSDALVPVFAGLYHWTPFFWGQTRFGLPLALLATPISDPVTALLFHFVAGHALLVLFAVALARLFLPRERAVAAGLALFALLVATTPARRFAFVCLTQPYVQSGAAGLAGLLLVRGGGLRRSAGGWLLLAVAFWIAPTTLFWLAPLALFAAGGGPPRRALAVAGGMAALALLAVALGALVPDVPRTPVAWASPASWPATWNGLAAGLWRAYPAGRALLALAAVCLSLLFVARRRWPAKARAGLRVAAALAAAAALHLLASGTLAWVADRVAEQRSGWRYAIPTQLLLAAIAPLALAAASAAGARDFRPDARLRDRLALGLALVAVAVAVPVRYGLPSLERARLSLGWSDGFHLDPTAHELLERGATHLLGDYWKVYPLALRANAIAYARGERRVVWPISSRAISARERWWRDDWTTARIALLDGDPWREGVRSELALPELEVVERGTTIEIARGAAAAASLSPRAPAP